MNKIDGSAILSADGMYRYALSRQLNGAKGTLGVIMINPSTADAETNDPTIRRLIGLANNMGMSKLVVANLFAFRSPDVKAMAKAVDPVGPDNTIYLRRLMQLCRDDGRVVVAWGANSKIPKTHSHVVADLIALSEEEGTPLWCWAKNADGSPKHPLYLPGNSSLTPWGMP